MKKPKPDTRLDWRDPEMPVIWLMHDNWTNKPVLMEISPEEAQHLARQIFAENEGPNWRDDPTYGLAKNRRRR